MTLIAAFRCYDGVVLCADQQETIGDVRVSINKLRPEPCGNYWLAIAGTGNGDLIDGFAYRLKLEMEDKKAWPEGLNDKSVYGRLQGLVQDYHENEVAFYPTDSSTEKLNEFLVCIQPVDKPDIFLWELRGTAIVPVGDYALIGVSESIYRHELKRLYQRNAFRQHAFFLAVHLFTLAKETSNYVGGATDVLFIGPHGMKPLQDRVVRGLESRMAIVNQKIAEILLACPDTGSVHNAELEGQLDKFKEEIMRLRAEVTGSGQFSIPMVTFRGTGTVGDPEGEESQ